VRHYDSRHFAARNVCALREFFDVLRDREMQMETADAMMTMSKASHSVFLFVLLMESWDWSDHGGRPA
jgi:hypothetical protein